MIDPSSKSAGRLDQLSLKWDIVLELVESHDGNTMPRRNAEPVDITRGTKNVFADLGYPDAVERQAKLRLAYALNQVLAQQKLTQTAAAKLLGLTQPKVSALRHYKLAGFSVERLMTLLTVPRPGRGDSDPEKAALAECCPNQCSSGVRTSRWSLANVSDDRISQMPLPQFTVSRGRQVATSEPMARAFRRPAAPATGTLGVAPRHWAALADPRPARAS